MKKNIRSLASIYATLFVDNLSATIVFPLFAPLFLDPSISIVASWVHSEIRMILLGFFLAVFPLAQFLFAPILGFMADVYGKKKVLLYTLFLGTIGYLLSGFGIYAHHLSLLMVGRFIAGVSASNLSICLSCLVDCAGSSEKGRGKYFSLGSAIVGSTFVLGPLIGGKLSDHNLYPLFSLSFPMWFGVFLTLINLLMVALYFRERQEKGDVVFDTEGLERFFVKRRVVKLFVIYFLYLFSWNLLFQFLPAFLVERFNAKIDIIGDVSALMGFMWIIGSIAASVYIHYHYSLKPLLIVSTLVYWISVIALIGIYKMTPIVLLGSLAIFCAGMIWPLFISAISSGAKNHIQGQVLGVTQSVQSLAMMLAPLFGGLLVISSFTPLFIVVAIATFFGFVLTCRLNPHESSLLSN